MGQILVEPGHPTENLQRAKKIIEEAAKHGCDIIVLPECMDLGWTFPGAHELAQPIPGPFSDVLVQAAIAHKIYIAAGLTEKMEDKLYNAAVLISPAGEILLKHRKINELWFAKELYATGATLGVASTPLGKIGLNICADNAPPATPIGHTLGMMGAEIIVSPSAWAVESDFDNEKTPYGDIWEESYTELAKKYQMPVIGVSNVGPVKGGEWDGWKCIGNSLAVDASGTIIVKGKHGENAEQLLIAEVYLK